MSRSGRKKKKSFHISGASLLIFVIVLALAVAGTVYFAGKTQQTPSAEPDPVSTAPVPKEEPKDQPSAKPSKPELPPEPTTAAVSLRCAGDIMAHQTQIDAARTSDDSFDFSEWFSLMQPYMDNCDLLLGNVETTFRGKGPYSGYPAFNSPDELFQTIVDTGIDVVLMSNNHMMDSGFDGLLRDIELFKDKGVLTVGAQYPEDDKFVITEVSGVKIGIVAYTYETQTYQGMRTVNGYAISKEREPYINSFGYQATFDQDMETIKNQMKLCREAGADVILLYMHWGEEYQIEANPWQRKMAGILADGGADIIIASHPHTIQEIEAIEVQNGDGSTKTVPVFYSIGNFISNQRAETLSGYPNARYTADAMLACVDFTYSFEDKRIIDIDFGCIPAWVERYKKDGKYKYYVLPLTEGFENSSILAESGHLSDAKQALADIINNVGGEDLIWQK